MLHGSHFARRPAPRWQQASLSITLLLPCSPVWLLPGLRCKPGNCMQQLWVPCAWQARQGPGGQDGCMRCSRPNDDSPCFAPGQPSCRFGVHQTEAGMQRM
jgi:hypothetical protein